MARPINRPEPDEWVMAQGAARILGVGPERVRAIVRDGQLPVATVIDGWKVFRRMDVEALKREREARGVFGNKAEAQ